MRLLADCGNSTIKLGLAHDGGLWIHERLSPTESALDGFLTNHPQSVTDLVILPGAQATTAQVRAWWQRVGAGKPVRLIGEQIALPDLGQYPGCGVDRVLAGLAACSQERKDVVVLDAGTATTITAWRQVNPRIRDPLQNVRFAGGLILPSARACIAGLAKLAPALPEVEPDYDAIACQMSTEGAIAGGIGIGYDPMIAACLARISLETDIGQAVITGGNAKSLLGGSVSRLAYRPSLVLEGVEILLRQLAK